METKTKCHALEFIESQREWYLKQLVRLAKLESFLEGVPEEIKTLEINLDIDYTGKISLLGFGEDTLKALQIAGAVGLRKTLAGGQTWAANGKVFLNGREVDVRVNSVEQPPACRLEEYSVTETRYKAICEETGEEIK